MWRLAILGALAGGVACAETVLILPFFDHSKAPNLEWIGESIAETVRDSLVSDDFWVLDREDRLKAYERLSLRPGAELTHASVIKLGQALDATKVVYGSYEVLSGENGDPAKAAVRITGRIIDLRQISQGPAFEELGALANLPALELRLGWQALRQLSPRPVPDEAEFLKTRRVVRVDAVESYVRGLLAASPEQQHQLFTQAARLDEKYSQPCYQLGKSFWEKKDYKVAAGWLERVAGEDSHYLEAQFFLGLCRYYSGDFAGAEEAFGNVAARVPLNEVFNNLGAAQARANHTEAAITSFQKALEGDSADPDYRFNLAYTRWQAGDFAGAVDGFREVVSRSPGDTEATTLLGRALKRDGPRPGDVKTQTRERLKTNYEEAAYRQLKAELAGK